MKEGSWFKLANFLKVFKYMGGFPLVLDPNNPTNVEDDSKLNLFYPCFFFVVFITLGIYTLTEYYIAYGFGVEGYLNMADYLNISLFEVIMIHATLSGSALLSMFAFALLVGKRKAICTVYKDVFKISQEIKKQGITVVRTSIFGNPVAILWFASGPLCIFTGSVFYAWASLRGYQEVTEPQNLPPWRNWLLASGVCLYTTWSISNPMVASISVICMDVLYSTSDCLRGLTKVIIQMDEIGLPTLNTGLKICHLAKDISTNMACFYLFMFAYFLLGGLTYTYGAFDIVFANPTFSSILMSAAFICFASIWFIFMCMLSAAGNNLRNAKDSLQEAMETHFLNSNTPSNGKIEKFKDALMRRLDKLAITPYNLFEVGNVSVLGVFATLITYLIIILQFRAT